MSKSLMTVILYQPFVSSKSKGSENQRASSASCNNEGYARDDNDRPNGYLGLVLPQPVKRPVNI